MAMPNPQRRTDRSRLASAARSSAAALLALAAGCAVGPNYRRPDVPVPAAFKEAGGWKQASPADAAARGPWWEVLGDPVLNGLESQVAAANLTLQQDAANYEEAREVARADQATFLPSFSVTGSAERSQSPSGRTLSTATGGSTVASAAPTNTFTASAAASWDLDFWGKIRRQTQADVAAAQASAADLASARLSTQAALATDYIELRVLDEKRRLLDHAVGDYRRTLAITQNKYSVGVAARSDVISAQAELDATRAQAVDVGVQRAQMEHAIAVLLGRPPADFSLAPQPSLTLPVPAIPPLMPGDLLERRPDVASAERAVVEANAKVGVATAAYFPDLTISAEGGFEGSILHRLFEAPNRFWSLGASGTDTLFDWGERRAELLEMKAEYVGSVANYRETVLGAFQQVEDDLAGLRILAEEDQIDDAAVTEAADAARIALNEYDAGTADYTTVVTAQVAEVTDRESALTVRESRLTTAVALVEALGGGWTSADLPSRHEVTMRRSEDPAAIAAP